MTWPTFHRTYLSLSAAPAQYVVYIPVRMGAYSCCLATHVPEPEYKLASQRVGVVVRLSQGMSPIARTCVAHGDRVACSSLLPALPIKDVVQKVSSTYAGTHTRRQCQDGMLAAA